MMMMMIVAKQPIRPVTVVQEYIQYIQDHDDPKNMMMMLKCMYGDDEVVIVIDYITMVCTIHTYQHHVIECWWNFLCWDSP